MFASLACFDVLGVMCAIMLFRMLLAWVEFTCFPKDFLAKSSVGMKAMTSLQKARAGVPVLVGR